MNHFVKSYLEQMERLVAELTRTLEQYETQIVQAQEAKEDLLKQNWSAQRRIHALEETQEQLPELDKEIKELKAKNEKTLEHAKRILDYSKALSGAIQQ